MYKTVKAKGLVPVVPAELYIPDCLKMAKTRMLD